MSYTVLARRYRSTSFEELVGQEPIARTLENAISRDRTAHAYLFCGTRGVGKTSLARIFAKALNVTGDLQQADDIAAAILRGDDLDVIEIDGASNRGIQEARDLIAGAGLSPTRCRYKIYIIDEVHMLTREAFNALLKTMEEPPSHVKFILCTTDPQKVPATIQSRCQRFDFRAIPTPLIAEQLRRILESEGIGAEDAVVLLVARMGNGSMRDALSLLDRLIAGGGDQLTIASAEEILGVPDRALLVQLLDAIADSQPRAALEAGAEFIARGATVEQALEMLTEHLRLLLLVTACGADSELVEETPEVVAAAQEQAAHFDVAGLVHLIAMCDAVGRNARGSATGRALFDAVLVRMCLSEQMAHIPTLVGGGAAPLPVGGGGGSGGGEASPGKKKGVERVPDPASARVMTPSAPTPSAPTPSAPTPSAPPGTVPPAAPPVTRTRRDESAAAAVEVKPDASASSDEALWPTVLEAAAASSHDQARVQHLAFRSFDGRTLHLEVAQSAARTARYLGRQTEPVADLVRRATGRNVKVRIDVPEVEKAAAGPATTATADVQKLPLVQEAVRVFDAVVTEAVDLPDAKDTDREAGEADV